MASGPGDANIYDVDAAANGDMFFIGDFTGQVYAQGTFDSAGSRDLLMGKFTPGGSPVWVERFGDAGTQLGRGISVSDSGFSTAVGIFSGTLDFGTGAHTANGLDGFVVRFDPSGTVQWSGAQEGAADQYALAVACGSNDESVVVGVFHGTMTIGGQAHTSQGVEDLFVAKYDAAGTPLWVRAYGDASRDVAKDVAVGSDGSVVVAGYFAGSIDFGGGPLVALGADDVFVLALDPNGNHVWSKRFGASAGSSATAVAMDGEDIVLVGDFTESIELGGSVLRSAGSWDVYAAKLNSDGEHMWSWSAGTANADYAAKVAVDPAGRVTVTGTYRDANLDIAGTTLTNLGGPDAFVVKLSTGGIPLWARRIGSTAEEDEVSVASDGQSRVIVGGWFGDVVDFGDGAVTPTAVDGFVVRYGP